MALEGSLDQAGASALRARLQSEIHPGSRVTLSLARVSHIDTAGIAVLIEASRLAKQNEVCLTLGDVSEAANKAIELARVRRFFAPE